MHAQADTLCCLSHQTPALGSCALEQLVSAAGSKPATAVQVQAKRLRLAGGFDFGEIARLTPGFVGADLGALMQEAAALAVRRVFAAIEQPAAASGPDEARTTYLAACYCIPSPAWTCRQALHV